ncbi:MAG: lysylphosphatidylglycerol synthase transmembrane domain-containing protein [Saprospiraceae bacterium]
MSFYEKHKSTIKIVLLLVVVAFVVQFVLQADMALIGEYLTKMPYTFLGILSFSFLAYLCATIAWKLCLGDNHANISIGRLFMMRHVGEMLSVFNPTSVIAGEALKSHFLIQKGISKEHSLSSILLSRVLIILAALLLILLSVLYMLAKVIGLDKGVIFIVLGLIFVSVFGYLLARILLHSKLYLHRFVLKLQQKFGSKYITDNIVNSVHDINNVSYLFYVNNKGKFFLAFFLSIVHWILGAAEFYLILNVLGMDISVIDAVAVEMGVILFKTLGAIIPGQLGVEEYANKIMLDMVGVNSNEVWLVVSIMRRARQLFWVGVAILFYWLVKKYQKQDLIT